MRGWATAAGLLFLSLPACQIRPPSPLPEQDPGAYVVLRDRNDVERNAGRWVVLEGTFHPDRGIHGDLTLDSGLVLKIPNFHRHPSVRGVPWTEWEGWRMTASGLLYATTPDVPDYDGPSFHVVRFHVHP